MQSEDNNTDQLRKYAEDLAKLYASVQDKTAELKATKAQLVKYAEDLNKNFSELKAAHQELQKAYLDTINRLSIAAEYKDEDTGNHIKRMSRYSASIAEKIGFSENEVQTILHAAPMHDVGKIGIPDSILTKPGMLTGEEFGIMTTHCSIGAKILASSEAEVLRIAQQVAISHHEQWNGKGYPQGIKKDEIPLVGRIIAVADTFDALTSRRPYKDPYPIEVSLDMMKKERGEHFDPDILDVFMENVEEILTIRAEVNQGKEQSPAEFRWSERDQALDRR